MKTVGIIGGLGPESTVLYYKRILEECRERTGGGNNPRIVIDSVDIYEMTDMLAHDDLSALAFYLTTAVGNITAAGADVAVIACNSAHVAYEDVRRRAMVPMISIVDAAYLHASTLGISRVGLLGTAYTMSRDFYKEPFVANGIEVFTPSEQDSAFMNSKIFSELEYGHVVPETKARFLEIMQGMQEEHGVEAFILGCTELPLILKPEDSAVPLIDTVEVHVQAIVDFMLMKHEGCACCGGG